MSIFDDLADLMPHSITVAPRTGELKGEPVYATGSAVITYSPCQVVEGPTRYRTNEGDTIIGTGKAIVAGTPPCPADGKATLPSGRLAPIQLVDGPYPDETGAVVQVVIFG